MGAKPSRARLAPRICFFLLILLKGFPLRLQTKGVSLAIEKRIGKKSLPFRTKHYRKQPVLVIESKRKEVAIRNVLWRAVCIPLSFFLESKAHIKHLSHYAIVRLRNCVLLCLTEVTWRVEVRKLVAYTHITLQSLWLVKANHPPTKWKPRVLFIFW